MALSALALLAALPDGALIIEASGIVTEANAHARDILQMNPQGLPATSVVRASAFAEALASMRLSGQEVTVETEFRGKPARIVSMQVIPLGSEGDVLALMRDLSREQAVEKMRSDFVANASHEMRTPLASIIGSIETLQGAAKNDAKAREQFLGTMLTQAHRMKRLIDDLLTLSRIELNEHVRPNTRVLLPDVARQAKANLAAAAEDAGVTVAFNATGDIAVAGNPDELLQVAQNLLENAIKYGSSGKRVEIDCYTYSNQGILVVKDFGKGIADIHLPRLTERFYRVSTQESRSRGGTGLGLAIVKHIVQRHRGKLAVASTEGQGSTFSVSIPLIES
jgi:two-component system, OmpR family, phosphate regulon sensor histidine kinase PhoR